VHYEPVSLADAQALAASSRHDFQDWVARRLGAVGGKRGSDKGVDGRIYFHDEPDGPTRQVIIQVKSGKAFPRDVKELAYVLKQERADIGVFVCMNEPTIAMRRVSSDAGNYVSVYWDDRYPKIQLITVKQLLEGRVAKYPPGDRHPVAAIRAEEGAALLSTDAAVEMGDVEAPSEFHAYKKKAGSLRNPPSQR
jgi:site-specific DNA-methyltransferase (adenine-specific)